MALGSWVIGSNMSSCRSAKKIQTAASKKDTTVIVPVVDKRPDSTQYYKQVYNAVNSNRVTNYKTFSAKVKVEYKGNVENIVLSGAVSRRKTASALLDVLAQTGQFHYRIEDDHIIIMP